MNTESHERPMYKAILVKSELIIDEVPFGVWRRIGTEGLGGSKVEAIEKLKRRIMNQFAADLKAIDWQSMEYVKEFAE